jgi:hypothetical protein
MHRGSITPSLQDNPVLIHNISLPGVSVGAHAELAAVFEVAWEVANKVEGVYTTIRSKAAETVKEIGEDYYLVVSTLVFSFFIIYFILFEFTSDVL